MPRLTMLERAYNAFDIISEATSNGVQMRATLLGNSKARKAAEKLAKELETDRKMRELVYGINNRK